MPWPAAALTLCKYLMCVRNSDKQFSLICGFAFRGFSYLQSTTVQKQMILLLMNGQKVSSGLMLCHNAYIIHLTTSHHVGILSFYIIMKRKASTVQ